MGVGTRIYHCQNHRGLKHSVPGKLLEPGRQEHILTAMGRFPPSVPYAKSSRFMGLARFRLSPVALIQTGIGRGSFSFTFFKAAPIFRTGSYDFFRVGKYYLLYFRICSFLKFVPAYANFYLLLRHL